MLENAESTTYDQLTLFAADSLANHFHWSEIDQEPTTINICGTNSYESFAKLDQDGLWRKMCQGYCQLTMDGILEPYLETWPRQGMMRNGTLYRLPISEQFTYVKEYSYWPTPRYSQDHKPIRPLSPSVADGRRRGQISEIMGHHYPDLVGSYIHPIFLEEMMGFPTGWTEV